MFVFFWEDDISTKDYTWKTNEMIFPKTLWNTNDCNGLYMQLPMFARDIGCKLLRL